jgi:hypothetical protein
MNVSVEIEFMRLAWRKVLYWDEVNVPPGLESPVFWLVAEMLG